MSLRTPPGIDDSHPFTPQTPMHGPMDEADIQYRKYEPESSSRSITQIALKHDHNHLLTPEDTPVRSKKNLSINQHTIGNTARILFPAAGTCSVPGSGRSYNTTSTSAYPSTPQRRIIRRSRLSRYSGLSSNNISSNGSRFDQHHLETITTPTKKTWSTTPNKVKQTDPKTPASPGFEIFSDRKAFMAELDDEKLSDHSRHPHLPPPDDTPGMWYVFRGKKIFRPFPKDEPYIDIKPKRLFSSDIDDEPMTKLNDKKLENFTSSEDDTDVEHGDEESSRDFFRKNHFSRKKTRLEKKQ